MNNDREVENELRVLEHRWIEAEKSRDAATLDQILADDFSRTNALGIVANKQEYIKTTTSPDLSLKAFDVDDVTIRIYGKVAVVSGRTTEQAEYKRLLVADTVISTST